MSHLVSLGLWEGIGEQDLEMFCSHARFCSLFWGVGGGTPFLMTIFFFSFLSSCDVVPLLLFFCVVFMPVALFYDWFSCFGLSSLCIIRKCALRNDEF